MLLKRKPKAENSAEQFFYVEPLKDAAYRLRRWEETGAKPQKTGGLCRFDI